MEKKKFEAPVLKVSYFECKDVVCSSTYYDSSPTNPVPVDPDLAKGRKGVAMPSKVSWD